MVAGHPRGGVQIDSPCGFSKNATLLKKGLAQVFSCEFCEISMNTFFTASGLTVQIINPCVVNFLIPYLFITPFVPNASFLYPVKTPENHKFSGDRESLR